MSLLMHPKRHPWVEDLDWHQHTFNCSRWRWQPQRPIKAAVRWLGGREIFTTPADYSFLEQRLYDAYLHNMQAAEAIGFRLLLARQQMGECGFSMAQPLLGFSDPDVSFLTWKAETLHWEGVGEARGSEWEIPLEDLPISNPIIEAWEIRQLREFYSAYEHLIEDALADLTAELLPRYGWEGLHRLVPDFGFGYLDEPRDLEGRFQRQRAARGEPGDPRRIAKTAHTRQRPGGTALGNVDFWTWM